MTKWYQADFENLKPRVQLVINEHVEMVNTTELSEAQMAALVHIFEAERMELESFHKEVSLVSNEIFSPVYDSYNKEMAKFRFRTCFLPARAYTQYCAFVYLGLITIAKEVELVLSTTYLQTFARPSTKHISTRDLMEEYPTASFSTLEPGEA